MNSLDTMRAYATKLQTTRPLKYFSRLLLVHVVAISIGSMQMDPLLWLCYSLCSSSDKSLDLSSGRCR